MFLNLKNRVLRSFRLNLLTDETSLRKDAAKTSKYHAPVRLSKSLFLRELARDPKSIGAICSSSERLGVRMAQHIELHQDGWVVELGGGTGAITRALLLHGVPPNKLIVIEKSRRLADHLCRRFPMVRVIHGDVADMDLALKGNTPVKAIVSGLPLRSLPKNTVTSITDACVRILPPLGRLIQFTYAPGGVSPWIDAGLEKIGSEIIWTNIPPARIEIFASRSRQNVPLA